MYEVEVKVPAAHEPVRDRLESLGAEHLGQVRQVDRYVDHPERSFAETDEAVRVRTIETDGEERSVLTYKGPRLDAAAKTREELETAVGDPETMQAVLDRLGFSHAATVEKERFRYRLDGTTVVLDDVAGLGEYVEVETVATRGDVESSSEHVSDVLETLGLDPSAAIPTSYLELVLEGD